MMAELFSFIDVGKMHFTAGDIYRLQCIKYCHAGVGIGCRIYDDGISTAVSLLNPVHYGALMIGLEEGDLYPLLLTYASAV